MKDKVFNLLYEPWIMVLNLEGESEEVSLLTVLERAHEFRCLAGELPTQDVAVLRLILAALYATFTRADINGSRKPIRNGTEALERWKSLWELKQFPIEPISSRLCHYEERFYLFHPERPFFQVAGLDRGTNYSAAKLMGNLSESGNKVRLFPVRTGDAKYSISYAEAARWLLYINAFDDTSSKPSVRGQKMPSPGAGWLGKIGVVYATGINLFETLMLNFVLLNDNGEPWSEGKATWELEQPKIEERVEISLPQNWFTALTLQSRRLLLQREGDSVTGYRLLGGDFFSRENAFTEQMTMWRKDAKEDIYLPKRHDPSRQLWRDFSVMLAEGEKYRKPGIVSWVSLLKNQNYLNSLVTFQIASVKYGDKDFYITDVFQDSLTINSNLFSQFGKDWITQVERLLVITEDCVRQLSYLASDLAKASGDSDSLYHKAGVGVGTAANAQAYFRLDEPFRKWLANIDPLQTDMEEAELVWKNVLKRSLYQLGEEMTHQAGEKAISGRWVKERLYTAPGALAKFRSKILRTIEGG